MFARLFILFTIVPVAEIYLLIKLGRLLGAGTTIAIVLLTGALGAYLARQQGFSVLTKIQKDLQNGIPPTDRLLDGALILVGGVVLLTPGFLTDLTGLLLLLPPTRRIAKSYLTSWAKKRINIEQGVIDV